MANEETNIKNEKKKKTPSKLTRKLKSVKTAFFGFIAFALVVAIHLGANYIRGNFNEFMGRTEITVQNKEASKSGWLLSDIAGNRYVVDKYTFDAAEVGQPIILVEGQYGLRVEEQRNNLIKDLFRKR